MVISPESSSNVPGGANYVLAAMLLLGSHAAVAAEVRTQLDLSLETSFLDNQFQGVKESGMAATLSPGLSIRKPEGRVQFDIDYRLDVIRYQDISESDREDHNLALNSRMTHDPAHWYSQLQGSVSRFNVDADGVQSANPLLETGNTSELQTLGLTTFINDEISRNLFFSSDAGVNRTDFEGSSPSDGAELGLRLNSEPGQGAFDWSVSARGQQNRVNSLRQDIDRFDLGLGYGFGATLRGFADFSRTETSLPKVESDSGLIGLEYRPSSRFLLKVAVGERDSSESYSLNLTNRLRHVDINAGYREEILAPRTQTLESLDQEDTFQTTFQDLSINPVLQKRGDLGVSIRGKRSLFGLTLFHSTSEQAGVASVKTTQQGIRAKYTRQLSRSSDLSLSVGSQETEQTEKNQLDDVAVGYTKRLSVKTDFKVELSHTQQDSNVLQNEYEQNVLSLIVRKQF